MNPARFDALVRSLGGSAISRRTLARGLTVTATAAALSPWHADPSAARKRKKGKKTCRAHDTGGCRAELESCSANRDITCTTTTGEDGFCHITTGNAPYCAFDGLDAECTKDEDCIELCGPLAACNVCAVPGQEETRFCGGPSDCTGP
jgi:hypothetical protein